MEGISCPVGQATLRHSNGRTLRPERVINAGVVGGSLPLTRDARFFMTEGLQSHGPRGLRRAMTAPKTPAQAANNVRLRLAVSISATISEPRREQVRGAL